MTGSVILLDTSGSMNAIPTIDAIEAWQPDLICIRAGDEHASLTIRCWSAAGLSDRAITQRIRRFFGIETDPPERYDAALALARHGAFVGASAREIVGWLARLALEVQCWPDDPDEIASMTCVALREAGR
jgi:hypothetical protein